MYKKALQKGNKKFALKAKSSYGVGSRMSSQSKNNTTPLSKSSPSRAATTHLLPLDFSRLNTNDGG